MANEYSRAGVAPTRFRLCRYVLLRMPVIKVDMSVIWFMEANGFVSIFVKRNGKDNFCVFACRLFAHVCYICNLFE